jgi:protein arginine kinase activator
LFGSAKYIQGENQSKVITEENQANVKKCPDCGNTFANFHKVKRLGCGQCYDTFKDELDPILENFHGALQHIGKCPPSNMSSKIVSFNKQIEQLEKDLKRAIKKEAYEKAGEINKQLKPLKEVKDQVATLSEELSEAIKKEEYELAQEINNKIKQLLP